MSLKTHNAISRSNNVRFVSGSIIFLFKMFSDTLLNDAIGNVTASDEDEDSLLKYSLEVIEAKDEGGDDVSGLFDSQFDIDEDSGIITVAEALDRELVETFKLKVTVTDENGTSPNPQTDEGELIFKTENSLERKRYKTVK